MFYYNGKYSQEALLINYYAIVTFQLSYVGVSTAPGRLSQYRPDSNGPLSRINQPTNKWTLVLQSRLPSFS